MAKKYYWEDLQAGQVRDLGSVTPTREAIIAFATQFDPQPFHLDDAAAQASVFGALCASGWHTCSMAMRLMGDTLRLQVRITDTRPMRSRPHVGMVRIVWDVTRQDDEKVLSMEGWAMFGRRHRATLDTPAA